MMIATGNHLIAEYETLLNEIATQSLDFGDIRGYTSLHYRIPALSAAFVIAERKGGGFDTLGFLNSIGTYSYFHTTTTIYNHDTHSMKKLFDTNQ